VVPGGVAFLVKEEDTMWSL